MKKHWYLALVSAAALTGLNAAQAQDGRPQPQIPTASSSIPIDSLPPGARALGLAGAFSAVADDATAAEANPAGQVQLTAPEFSIHFRDTDTNLDFYDAEARNPGNLGSPTGRLLNNFSDSKSNISFASFVYPWERFVFSAFYTNNADIDAVAPTDTVFNSELQDRYISTNTLGAEFDGYGLSLAWRANDFFSVGLSVKQTELTVAALDQVEIEDFLDFEILLNSFRGDISIPDYAAAIDDNFLIGSRTAGSDKDVTFTAGILFNPAGKWSWSLVYKDGGEYDIDSSAFFNQRLACIGDSAAADVCRLAFSGVDLSEFNMSDSQPIRNEIDLPDYLTFGIAWRPTDDGSLLLSFDINNIDYGDLPQPRRTTLGFEFPVDGRTNAIANDVEEIGDAVTYHFGAEKVFFLNDEGFLNLLTVRAGAFTDDDHDGTRLLDTDDTHLTVGVGAVLMDFRLQVDIAAEFSDRTDNVVLSAIYRF